MKNQRREVYTAVDGSTGEDSGWPLLRLQLMSSVCHGIYIAWHFLAMLVFMTYNVGCCVVVVLGAPLTEPLAYSVPLHRNFRWPFHFHCVRLDTVNGLPGRPGHAAALHILTRHRAAQRPLSQVQPGAGSDGCHATQSPRRSSLTPVV